MKAIVIARPFTGKMSEPWRAPAIATARVIGAIAPRRSRRLPASRTGRTPVMTAAAAHQQPIRTARNLVNIHLYTATLEDPASLPPAAHVFYAHPTSFTLTPCLGCKLMTICCAMTVYRPESVESGKDRLANLQNVSISTENLKIPGYLQIFANQFRHFLQISCGNLTRRHPSGLLAALSPL